MSELELEQKMNIKFLDDYHLPEDDNHHSHRRGNLKSYIKFLVKLGKSGSEIREMFVQLYRNNAMKKTAVHK
jgi:hypothetical protein